MNIQCNKNVEIPKGFAVMERPVYLYGIGVYADRMLEILNKYHIAVKGILVSEEYYGNKIYKGIPVRIYREIDQEEYIIVAGFDVLYHKELVDRLVNAKNVNKLYVLNGLDIFFRNDFRFLHPKVHFIDNHYRFLLEKGLNYEYYCQNKSLFDETYSWLEDELSRKVMEAYLKGNIELTNFPMLSFWQRNDWSDQYFVDLVKLNDYEVVIDCGAYKGDTFIKFRNRVKMFKRYYAFEPNRNLFAELIKTLEEAGGSAVHIPLGAWNEKSVLPFTTIMDCGTIVDTTENVEYIECDAIDNIVAEDEIVTFIKMDVEGAELNALLGAERTIKRNRPKLAISIYHKKEDLITIPQYIKSIAGGGYKLYLRPHMPYAAEMVLYGIPV